MRGEWSTNAPSSCGCCSPRSLHRRIGRGGEGERGSLPTPLQRPPPTGQPAYSASHPPGEHPLWRAKAIGLAAPAADGLHRRGQGGAGGQQALQWVSGSSSSCRRWRNDCHTMGGCSGSQQRRFGYQEKTLAWQARQRRPSNGLPLPLLAWLWQLFQPGGKNKETQMPHEPLTLKP